MKSLIFMLMLMFGRCFLFICFSFLSSCGPIPDIRELKEIDLSPPVLTGVRTISCKEIEISFDEPAIIKQEDLNIKPDLPLLSIELKEHKVIIITCQNQIPGIEYILKTTVKDNSLNSTNIMAGFFGFNPDIPCVKINEFITRGSGNHPDIVELKVFTSGNMGGLVIYQGTPGNWKDRLVFPAFIVREGEFILVHFKPQCLDEEINETDVKTLSGGLDASDNAYDFWVKGGTGISGNNGVLSIYSRPGGSIIDGVLYSNRTSDSDEYYMGFGTRATMERAVELATDLGWLPSEDIIRPEDGVNPDGSTGTRSLCRKKGPDSDTRNDWYIVPTRHSTFGQENSEDQYM